MSHTTSPAPGPVTPPLICRSCGQDELVPVLSLGRTPLANALLTQEQLGQPEPTFPLELVFCPHCTLAQITETVPPEVLFRDYVYFSSYSETMLAHARSLAERLTGERRLGRDSLVVEVASNDGYLLQYYRQQGVPVLGIEPARNIARVAEERQVPTLCEFFTGDLAKQLAAECRRADVIHANNVLAHVAELNGFVAGLRTLVHPGGVIVVEVPYLVDLIEQCEFDTIYHEHLCYFSLTALDRLFRRHKLAVWNVERLPIHGGSLRLFAGRNEVAEPIRPAVTALLAQEQQWGVARPERYQEFGKRVEGLAGELRNTLLGLKRDGKRLAAYGASAKGSTLLNYLRLPEGTLEFVADRSPVKQGRYTPGTRLPICPPNRLLESSPDYVVLLTWNFASEILAQQSDYRRHGGKFLIPIPDVQVA